VRISCGTWTEASNKPKLVQSHINLDLDQKPSKPKLASIIRVVIHPHVNLDLNLDLEILIIRVAIHPHVNLDLETRKS